MIQLSQAQLFLVLWATNQLTAVIMVLVTRWACAA